MAPVMSTPLMPLRMTLIVAMSMESEKIAGVICPAFTPRSDVVDLDQIALLKEQFAPTAFSLLFVEQGSQSAHGKRMRLL
jgi:hypothetical protein